MPTGNASKPPPNTPSTPGASNPNTFKITPELLQRLPGAPAGKKSIVVPGGGPIKDVFQGIPAIALKHRASIMPSINTSSGGDNVSVAAPRGAALQDFVNKLELMKRSQFNLKKMTQLCSFIPDFIMMDEISRKIPYNFSFEAIVLMADISGFTALTEVRLIIYLTSSRHVSFIHI